MERRARPFTAIFSSDWSECLSPSGPFDFIGFAYPQLGSELQEIFLTAAKEAGAEQRTWLQTAAADMLSKMEDGGCTIIDDVDVAAFQEACAPVYEAYRDKIGSDLLDRAVAAVQ